MTTTEITTISPETLHAWMDSGKAFHLIHTLPHDHFQCARIPGAANACVYEVAFMEQVYAITREKAEPVVVYGDSAATMAGPVAAEKLVREGFTNVCILEGGLQRWQTEGFELEGRDASPPEDPGTSPALQAGAYTLDLESSVIEWAGRNPNSTHVGTVRLLEGGLVVADGSLSGEFKIDMHSIENINLQGDELQPVLEAHLKSDDFFFVKLFPRARYHLKSARPVVNAVTTLPNYQVDGDLELRGVSAPLGFAAHLLPDEDGGILAEAHFDFDRTKWGIIYGSSRFFSHLGIHVIYDLISVQLRLRLVPV